MHSCQTEYAFKLSTVAGTCSWGQVDPFVSGAVTAASVVLQCLCQCKYGVQYVNSRVDLAANLLDVKLVIGVAPRIGRTVVSAEYEF